MSGASKTAVARRKARSLLKELSITRIPTPLPRIARALDLIIEYTPLDMESSGMALVKEGRRLVWVNALLHPNRQRFTLAHEIGHHVMHDKVLEQGVHVDKGILRRDVLSAKGTDELELQANAFASELLMPAEEIDRALEADFDLDDRSAVEGLAQKFKVSLAAMQYRLMRV